MSNALGIYVVDDDEDVLLSAQALLSQHGYQARCFLSAEQFLSETHVEEPGCVLTDVRMPGMTGLDLQERLREAHSPLSVVVVTGAADVRTAVQLMERGAVTLLEKPYDQASLLQAIHRGQSLSYQRWRRKCDAQDLHRRLGQLTNEERAVMDAMLADDPNKAIALRLKLAMRTVDRRRRSVLEKMGVGSTTELARLLSAATTSDDAHSDG